MWDPLGLTIIALAAVNLGSLRINPSFVSKVVISGVPLTSHHCPTCGVTEMNLLGIVIPQLEALGTAFPDGNICKAEMEVPV